MNYTNLQKILREQLEQQLARIEQIELPDGIVDMTLTFTSVDSEDTTHIVKFNVEVVEMVGGEWEVEDVSTITFRHPYEEV